MASLSPTELARRMGLAKDGTPVDVTTAGSLKSKTDEGVKYLAGWNSLDNNEKNVFALEFESQFLPSLLRTYLLPDPETLNHFALGVLIHDTNGPSFPRFVRCFPEDASAVYLKLGQDLSRASKTLERSRSISAITFSIRLFTDIFFDLITYLPPGSPLPSFPPFVKTGLRALEGACGSNLSLQHAMANQGLLPDSCKQIFRILSMGETDRGRLKDRFVARDRTVVWETCEGRVAGRVAKNGSVCVAIQEGEDMKMCGACLSVRYCSIEHQRADWKRHKRLCFRPSWGKEGADGWGST